MLSKAPTTSTDRGVSTRLKALLSRLTLCKKTTETATDQNVLLPDNAAVEQRKRQDTAITTDGVNLAAIQKSVTDLRYACCQLERAVFSLDQDSTPTRGLGEHKNALVCGTSQISRSGRSEDRRRILTFTRYLSLAIEAIEERTTGRNPFVLENIAGTSLENKAVVVFRGVKPGAFESLREVNTVDARDTNNLIHFFDTYTEAALAFQRAQQSGVIECINRVYIADYDSPPLLSFVVSKGAVPGIYDSLEEAVEMGLQWDGGSLEVFLTQEEADEYFDSFRPTTSNELRRSRTV
ncbi:hypothetical protein VNI00_018845 [Paramarasmius palmivorus]|uniref:Uncharacterized protein n=1 Tax=Paramarasmius palmivorus TaxID=297713 RepID=A0AAW0AU18_9AGAR